MAVWLCPPAPGFLFLEIKMKSSIFSRLRNFMAVFVLSVSVLCTGVGGSYFAAYEVHGMEMVTNMVMHALIEAIMASMGLAFSSTSDLNNVATGLDSMMAAQPDFTYKGVKVFEKIQETLSAAKLGATVVLPYVCAEWLCEWLYGTSSSVISKSSDVVNQSSSLVAPGTQVIYGDFSKEFFLVNNLFYGYSLFNRDYNSISICDDEPFINSKIVVSIFNIESGTFSVSYSENPCILLPKALETPTQLGGRDKVVVDSVFELLTATGGAGIFKQCYFAYSNTAERGDFFRVGNGVYSKSVTNDDGTITYRLNFQNPDAYIASGFNGYDYAERHLLPASSSNAQVRIFVDKGTRFYESYEQYKTEKLASAYAPSSAIYGLSSSSKELEEDEVAGTVSLQLTEAQLTSTIEKAVADAIAANPSITEEELNAMVAAQVGTMNGIKDSVDENTEVLTGLTGIMQNVLSVLKGLADAILTGLVSLVVPAEGFIETQINNIMNRLNDMGIAPFDMSGIFTDEEESPFKDITIEVYGQEAVIVSFAHLDMFLDKFRPAIRGLIALFLIFYSINQFFSLIRLAGVVEGGHVNSMSGLLTSVMSQGDSGRIGQKGELMKR